MVYSILICFTASKLLNWNLESEVSTLNSIDKGLASMLLKQKIGIPNTIAQVVSNWLHLIDRTNWQSQTENDPMEKAVLKVAKIFHQSAEAY